MTTVLGYGEDSLTLWLLKDNLRRFLDKFQDMSSIENCRVFYRPSFGRNPHSSFGEFDAIVLSEYCLYLCESKWDDLTGRGKPTVKLSDAQLTRHKMFMFYVHEWAYGRHASWEIFKSCALPEWEGEEILKSIPRSSSLLANNLRTVLRMIEEQYSAVPEISTTTAFKLDAVGLE